MKNIIILLSALFLVSCGGAGLDQTKPENLMNIMFQAAQTGDFSQLSSLCQSDGSGDGDVRDVCSCGDKDANPELLESYKAYFSKGEVTATRIDGKEAEVDFNFGPDGDEKETMKMVEIDGKWYLGSF